MQSDFQKSSAVAEAFLVLARGSRFHSSLFFSQFEPSPPC